MARRAPWLLMVLFLGACSGVDRPMAASGPTTSTSLTSSSRAAPVFSSTTAPPVALAPSTLPPPYAAGPPPPTLPPTPAAVWTLVPAGWQEPYVTRASTAGSSFLWGTTFVATDTDDRIHVIEVFPASRPGAPNESSADDPGTERFGPYRGRLHYGGRGGNGNDRPDWGIVEVQVPTCGVVGVASLGLDEPTLRATAATATCRAGAGTDVTPPAGFRRVPAIVSGDAAELQVRATDRGDSPRSITLGLVRASYLDVAALAGPRAVGEPITLGGRRAWWNLFDPPPTDAATVSNWQATVDVGPGRALQLAARSLTRPEVEALVTRVVAGFDAVLPPPVGDEERVLFDRPADGATLAVRTAGDRPVVQWSDGDGGAVWAMVVPSRPSGFAYPGAVLAQADVLGTTVDIDTSRGTWSATVQAADGRWVWLAASGVTPARVRAVLGGLHAVDAATWTAFTTDHPPITLRP